VSAANVTLPVVPVGPVRASWKAATGWPANETTLSKVTVMLVTDDRCTVLVCPALTPTLCTLAPAPVACISKAPMSAAGPTTRAKVPPRWSVVRLAGLEPASIAGLPVSSAWVCVGPPLLPSAPRLSAVPNGGLLPLPVPGVNPAELPPLLGLTPV
jgi:hypothetical protein